MKNLTNVEINTVSGADKKCEKFITFRSVNDPLWWGEIHFNPQNETRVESFISSMTGDKRRIIDGTTNKYYRISLDDKFEFVVMRRCVEH